jgi:orotidine-5'-phosphate decarboxylase
MAPSSRLILALDVSESKAALRIVDQLRGLVQTFKVGPILYTSVGPLLLREIQDRGCGVFLDLKFHDIPHTVAHAVLEAARMGVRMLTLHALGGSEMMRRTREILDTAAAREGIPSPALLGVTILTSTDSAHLQETFRSPLSLSEMVVHLTDLACRSGMDGVVASPWELPLLSRWPASFKKVTPGIRMAPEQIVDDQKRCATPRQAIRDGADFIVVGRPILDATDRVRMTEAILTEISEAEQSRLEAT